MSNWNYQWVTDWDEIWSQGFLEKWEHYLEKACNSHVFFHPALIRAWVETYQPIRNIKPLFLIAQKKRFSVFFPLVIWKMNWKNAFIRKIIPAGYSDFDYQTPFFIGEEKTNTKDFWFCLFREINKSWKKKYDIIEISSVQKCFLGGVKKEKEEGCPCIDLSQYMSYIDFINRLKPKERRDVNSRTKQLKSKGSFKFHIFKGEEKDLFDNLEIMLEKHSKRWPNAYKAPGFHRNLVKRAARSKVLHFSNISIDGVAISWILSFFYKNKYYFYMPALDDKYAKYSPTKVHLFMCIEDMIDKGCVVFDLLKGAESYKQKWFHTKDELICDLKITNNSTLSHVKKGLLSLKQLIG